tara:strand:- start:887 stop:1141 length:255 start_codon:yes stop_codon:yes gene_type:complete
MDAELGTTGMKNLGAAGICEAPSFPGTPPGSTGARSVLLELEESLLFESGSFPLPSGAVFPKTSTYRFRTCDIDDERDNGLALC